MNTEYVKKILGHFQREKTVRLADLSGDTNWRKCHRFCSDGSKPLPYNYDSGVNLRQMEIFRTAKEFSARGQLEIFFEKGENWFIRPQNWMEQFSNLTFLDMEVAIQ